MFAGAMDGVHPSGHTECRALWFWAHAGGRFKIFRKVLVRRTNDEHGATTESERKLMRRA
eukprot:1353021-Prymnesium_polylepis.2